MINRKWRQVYYSSKWHVKFSVASVLLSLQVWPRNLVKEEEECYLCYFIPPKVLHCKVVRDKSFWGGGAALLQLWLHIWCSQTPESFTWALLEPEHICEPPQAREDEQKTIVNWCRGRAETHRTQLKQKSKSVPCGHKSSACWVAWSSVGCSSAPLWQASCSTCTVCICEVWLGVQTGNDSFGDRQVGLCKSAWTVCITTCTKVHSSRDNGQSVLLLFQKSCHVLDLSERRFSWPGVNMPGFGSRHCILSYSFSCSRALSQLNDDPKIIPSAASSPLELLHLGHYHIPL